MEIKHFSPLIHIGFPKTATTFLQKNIFSNSDYNFIPITDSIVRNNKKLYEGRFKIKGFAGYFLTENNGGRFLSPYQNRTKEIHKEIKLFQEIQDYKKNKICVLSNERLCGPAHAGFSDSKDICDRIHDAFPKAKILITIREQREMINSLYFQYLTTGGRGKIRQYLHEKFHDYGTSAFRPSSLNYNEMVQYYSQKFGSSNVLILPFELLKENNNDFFDRLYKFLSIEKPKLEISSMRKENVTKSRYLRYKLRHLFFLFHPGLDIKSPLPNRYLYQILTILTHQLSKVVPKKLEVNFEKKVEEEIEIFCKNRYTKPNDELKNLINMDLEKYNYL